MAAIVRWCGGARGGVRRHRGCEIGAASRQESLAEPLREAPSDPPADCSRSYSAQWTTSLFDTSEPARSVRSSLAADAPLAVRMRPRSLDELVGQEHVLGEGSALRTAIESGHPHSAILYGPPGAGKTTLARIAACRGGGGVRGGVGGQRRESRDPRGDRAGSGAPAGRRAADDPLPRRDPPLQQGAAGRAAAGGRGGAADPDRGDHREPLLRGQLGAALALPDLRAAAAGAGAGGGAAAAGAGRPRAGAGRPAAGRGRGAGDARRSAAAATPGSRSRPSSGRSSASRGEPVDVAAIEDALQRKALDYDRQGDRHYDFVSAWIKATRGSDVDASLYYLAVMLEGGEDPRFIARRMVILASEDVGNADPQALLVADAAARAVDRVGLPECALNLAQAAVYLALAPKSNASYKALGARPRRGPRERRQDPAGLPARRPLPRRQVARPRRGLPLRARRAGRRQRPAAAARRPRGPPLLRAHRPRLRGRAGTASGGAAQELRQAL